MNASGDVTISGNLNIVGNASEINVDNLSVDEPLIKLANGNTSDTLDSGTSLSMGKTGPISTASFTGMLQTESGNSPLA